MGIQLNLNQSVADIFNIEQKPQTAHFAHVLHPFWFLESNNVDAFLRGIVTFEINYRNTQEDRFVRSQLLSSTRFPLAAQFCLPQVQVDIRRDKATGEIKQDQIRERGDIIFPISLIIWFAAWIYSQDKYTRSLFTNCLRPTDKMPYLMLETFKKNREGMCGIFHISPAINETLSALLCTLCPILKGTLLDYSYLISQEGIDSFISFSNELYAVHPKYVRFVDAVELLKLNFFSISTVTQGALGVVSLDHSHFAFSNELKVLQHNSHEKGYPNGVNISDAFCTGATFVDLETGKYTTPSYSVGVTIPDIHASKIAHYIVKRALGIVTNSIPGDELQTNSTLDMVSDVAESSKEIAQKIEKIRPLKTTKPVKKVNNNLSFNKLSMDTFLKYLFNLFKNKKLTLAFA